MSARSAARGNKAPHGGPTKGLLPRQDNYPLWIFYTSTNGIEQALLNVWRFQSRSYHSSMSTRWPMDSLASLSGTLIVPCHSASAQSSDGFNEFPLLEIMVDLVALGGLPSAHFGKKCIAPSLLGSSILPFFAP